MKETQRPTKKRGLKKPVKKCHVYAYDYGECRDYLQAFGEPDADGVLGIALYVWW